MRIGIIAGELSGDILGAGLVAELKKHYPHAVFEGIAGPKMQALGVKSLYPMETLSVIGLAAVLKKIVPILKARAGIIKHFIQTPPDIFIGIDAPDFNLTVEEKLHQKGIKTIHYVSPSIWAWKAKRIHKIKRATDAVLCILPFEVVLYEKHQHPAFFVGHPLADEIPLETNQILARQTLGLALNQPCLALLPGSRSNEYHALLEAFLKTAQNCKAQIPELQMVLPVAHPKLRKLLEPHQALLKQLSIHLLEGQSRLAMAAADVVLLSSGTATLEAMLLKKPMVVAYRLGWLSAQILRRLIKIRHFALPNILSGTEVVPEFIQENMTVEQLTPAVLNRLLHKETNVALIHRFDEWHRILKQSASEKAAEVVKEVLTGFPSPLVGEGGAKHRMRG